MKNVTKMTMEDHSLYLKSIISELTFVKMPLTNI